MVEKNKLVTWISGLPERVFDFLPEAFEAKAPAEKALSKGFACLFLLTLFFMVSLIGVRLFANYSTKREVKTLIARHKLEAIMAKVNALPANNSFSPCDTTIGEQISPFIFVETKLGRNRPEIHDVVFRSRIQKRFQDQADSLGGLYFFDPKLDSISNLKTVVILHHVYDGPRSYRITRAKGPGYDIRHPPPEIKSPALRSIDVYYANVYVYDISTEQFVCAYQIRPSIPDSMVITANSNSSVHVGKFEVTSIIKKLAGGREASY